MGFLDNLFDNKNNNDKKSGGSGGMQNPFANLGGQRTFHGQGQSLGGSKPGTVIAIQLPNPGPLGVRVEKRANSEGTAIVSEVVAGSQAEAAGLKRGDILCFAGSNGQEEIMYDMFLELARSPSRPIELEVRRITTQAEKPVAEKKSSADAEIRRQAVIAAAEAREKAHKAKTKPVQRVTKTTLARQQGLAETAAAAAEVSKEPLSEEARRAAAAAKEKEAALAAQLGYNPYETARASGGQARVATTTVQHGNITADNAGDHLPSVSPPPDALVPAPEPHFDVDLPSDFQDAFMTLVSVNEAETAKSSCGIMKKLLLNAATKGQMPGEEAAKFRKVRLANPKIKAALVDVQGAVELMLSTGFSLEEQDGESVLIFPADYPGPDWLEAAVKQLDRA